MMNGSMQFDAIIVGGGIAGLQAAIQLGRYSHRVLVIDAGEGRSTMCRSYRNVLGYPDGVSGADLRRIGKQQGEALGVHFVRGEAVRAVREARQFYVFCRETPHTAFGCRVLLLATGVRDNIPPLPGLRACLGLTVFVCPDCDGYETKGKPTVVLGSGNAGAAMAEALTYWTDQMVYINHDSRSIDADHRARLHKKAIEVVEGTIREVRTGLQPWQFRAAVGDGGEIAGERAFIAFGHNEVRSSLAAQLGVERMENKHIITDARTKMTSVPGVWAAGDVAVHSEQLAIAMGEGSQAAIWMHKSLLHR